MNLTSDFGIQNGGSNMVDMKFLKLYDFRISLYSTVFEVVDYEFDFRFSEFIMADPIWKTYNFGNPAIFVELCT